jgi:hypothetical protein
LEDSTVLARRWFIGSLLAVGMTALVGLTAAAPAPDTTTLKWKFEKDKPFYQEMLSDTTQNMKVAGSEIKNVQKQTFYFSWTPVEQDKDGNWILKQKIEGVKMKIEISGSPPIDYDSTKEGAANTPLGDFFKVLVGSEFKLTIDKDMKVTKIEGREDFIKKLGGANPQMEPLLKQILSEDALKEMADPTFAAIKTSEIKVGDTWNRPSKFDMGPIGKYVNDYKYTYQGKDQANAKLDRIKVDTTVKYEKPDDAAFAGGLPFKIKTAELTPKNPTGYILFDNEKGRVENSESNLELSGKLGIEIGGQTTNVELSQTQKTSSKTTDTNPIAKK